MTAPTQEREPYGSFVVTWHYSDGSAYGVVGVYNYASRADAVVSYLEELDSGRQFKRHEIVRQPEITGS